MRRRNTTCLAVRMALAILIFAISLELGSYALTWERAPGVWPFDSGDTYDGLWHWLSVLWEAKSWGWVFNHPKCLRNVAILLALSGGLSTVVFRFGARFRRDEQSNDYRDGLKSVRK